MVDILGVVRESVHWILIQWSQVFGNCWRYSFSFTNRQAVTKDLTSSSKFSGSCVLTLQTLPLVFIGVCKVDTDPE